MTIHELKTWPEFFEPLRTGDKRCEVRKDDRGFSVGDKLNLREWDQNAQRYTGRVIWMRVTHILRGGQFGIKPGHVCMSVFRDA